MNSTDGENERMFSVFPELNCRLCELLCGICTKMGKATRYYMNILWFHLKLQMLIFSTVRSGITIYSQVLFICSSHSPTCLHISSSFVQSFYSGSTFSTVKLTVFIKRTRRKRNEKENSVYTSDVHCTFRIPLRIGFIIRTCILCG